MVSPNGTRNLIRTLTVLGVFIGHCLVSLGQNERPLVPVTIRAIEVTEQPDALIVSVSATGNISSPHVFRMANPSRLVFDFSNTVPSLISSRVNIGKQNVTRVRVGFYRTPNTGTPTTRIVFDLAGPVDSSMETTGDDFAIRLVGKASGIVAERAAVRPVDRETPISIKSLTPRGTNSADNASNLFRRIDVSSPDCVVLEFARPAKPLTTYLTRPDRVVLDFPDTAYSADWNQPSRLPVNGAAVKAVRSSIFSRNPLLLRVVIDQNSSDQSSLSSVENRVVLRFSPPTSGATVIPAETGRKAATTASVPSLETAPVRQFTPNPPVVSYQDGLLSLDARNSKLSEVLLSIATTTGANIEIPSSEEMDYLILIKIGPAPPSDVIAAILQGTSYDYYIVENGNGDLEKVILNPK